MLHLKITTPRKKVVDRQIESITVPSASGELTILPKHVHLLSLLKEGIITIKSDQAEEYMAIGGGYFETDGKTVNILVSRAYNQDEIDEAQTEKAIESAEKMIQEAKGTQDLKEATATLRRSLLDKKLLQKIRRRQP